MKTFFATVALALVASPVWACFTDSDCAADQLCECAPRDARGICQSAGVCVARHPDETERQSVPFFPQIDEALPTTSLAGEAEEENPRDFVRIVSLGKCGPPVHNGRFLAIENNHPDQPIYVTYSIRFFYQAQPRVDIKTGKWSAGRTNPIGCTVPGPTGQRFTFTIQSARF